MQKSTKKRIRTQWTSPNIVLPIKSCACVLNLFPSALLVDQIVFPFSKTIFFFFK